MTLTNNVMLPALDADQPNAALASKLQLYGRFVGSWRADIDHFLTDGSVQSAEGEWHFGWVLDGKAIQDVWIFPARRLRDPARPEPWHRYGSTVRWYDPSIDAWHITWFDPSHNVELRQIGRAVGNDIEQMGDEVNGVTRRWRFVEITPRSFRWLGDVSSDRGATWALEMEMRARRET